MVKAMGVALLLVCAACDGPPMPGESCGTADQMVCGKASGGTGAALLCTPGASGAEWQYATNCSSCDHVLGCKTEVICNGLNVANNGLHCDVQGVGACDINRNHLLLKCDATNTWSTLADCSQFGMVCGRLPDGNLGCV